MTDRLTQIIRRHHAPLAPLPTGVPHRLRTLPGIRAVLFDIYGTMLISGSGDVGTASSVDRSEAATQALAAVGINEATSRTDAFALLRSAIREQQGELREQGIEYPEVDIVAAWRTALTTLRQDGRSRPDLPDTELQALAVEFESRANPTDAMPHVAECLASLRRNGLVLGIISNAQFFTPLLFPVLLDADVDSLGFAPDLTIYSYRFREAKPGSGLYQRAAAGLAHRGISPGESLYIGNDMLNDVAGASQVGFRTALFAGDSRSLRLREGDPRVEGIVPDLVITDLRDLPRCITP